MNESGLNIHLISRSQAKNASLKKYFTGKPCINGHISERYTSTGDCLGCYHIRAKKYKSYRDNYYRDNRDLISEKRKLYYQENRTGVLSRNKKWRENNNELLSEIRRKYYESNKEDILHGRREKYSSDDELRKQINDRNNAYRKNHLDKIKECQREYRKRNKDKRRRYYHEVLKVNENSRAAMICRRVLKNLLANMKRGKGHDTEHLLGYSKKEFKEAMEKLFLEGMSWGNHGEWHLDHKKPVSHFLTEGVSDIAEINKLDNLLPMWKQDNLSKGTKTLENWLLEKGEGSDEWVNYIRSADEIKLIEALQES